MRLPTLIQLSGLTELIAVTIFIPAGAGASVNCDEPGNRKEGYCNEKDQMVHEWPASENALQRRSLKVVMPPGLMGCAGPIMMIFLELVIVNLNL